VRPLALWGHGGDRIRKMIVNLFAFSARRRSRPRRAFRRSCGPLLPLTRDADFLRRCAPVDTEQPDLQGREAQTGLCAGELLRRHPHPVYPSIPTPMLAAGCGHEVILRSWAIDRAPAWPRGSGSARDPSAVEKSQPSTSSRPLFDRPVARRSLRSPTASRLGSYWCLMAPYVLGFGRFSDGLGHNRWITELISRARGVAMGMIRFTSIRPVCQRAAVDDSYSCGMPSSAPADDVAGLVSFSANCQGLRAHLVGAEGTAWPARVGSAAMVPAAELDQHASALWILRYLLVQGWAPTTTGAPTAAPPCATRAAGWPTGPCSDCGMPTAFGRSRWRCVAPGQSCPGTSTCAPSPSERPSGAASVGGDGVGRGRKTRLHSNDAQWTSPASRKTISPVEVRADPR